MTIDETSVAQGRRMIAAVCHHIMTCNLPNCPIEHDLLEALRYKCEAQKIAKMKPVFEELSNGGTNEIS